MATNSQTQTHEIPFCPELIAAWARLKGDAKPFILPIFSITVLIKLVSMIPSVGVALSLLVGWPLSWIFYVGMYRKLKSHDAGETLTFGTLLDQLGDEWKTILMAQAARYVRILAAGFWMIYPAIEKSGQLILVPQVLAFDRNRRWNASELSEHMMDHNEGGDGWKLVGTYLAMVLVFGLAKLILSWLLPTVVAVGLVLILNTALALYITFFFYEIWLARKPQMDAVPIAANHQWDAPEYWNEIKSDLPRAGGAVCVLIFAIALIGFSGIETLIHFVH